MPIDLNTLPIRAVDCLKICYKLRERGERITTSYIRQRLERLEKNGKLSDASVTQLFKWLAVNDLVRHTPYHGVELTEHGLLVSAELVRHHRLLELFLVNQMGFPIEHADAEAERLEHAISEEFEDRMDALLGFPTEDPHGDPIPSRSGEVIEHAIESLESLPLGEERVVRRISDDDPDRLRYLSELQLVPGTRVMVQHRAPYGGPLTVRVHGSSGKAHEHAIGPELATTIWVSKVPTGGLHEHERQRVRSET